MSTRKYGLCSVCGFQREVLSSGNIRNHWRPAALRTEDPGTKWCPGSGQRPVNGSDADLVAMLTAPESVAPAPEPVAPEPKQQWPDGHKWHEEDLVHKCGGLVPAGQDQCSECLQPVFRLPQEIFETARDFEKIVGLDQARISLLGLATRIYMAGWEAAMEQVARAQTDAFDILIRAAEAKKAANVSLATEERTTAQTVRLFEGKAS